MHIKRFVALGLQLLWSNGELLALVPMSERYISNQKHAVWNKKAAGPWAHDCSASTDGLYHSTVRQIEQGSSR